MLCALFIISTFKFIHGDLSPNELQFLNQLPLDKLLQLKNSFQDLVTPPYENFTTSTPSYLQRFGAQALAVRAPLRRKDYDGDIKKHGSSKISHIFSKAITTLAFLAFAGYLLCLIVQAMRQNQNNQNMNPSGTTTVLLNSAGIKKKPQFSQYGRRRKRDARETQELQEIQLPPEQLFGVLVQLCEGYAKWSEQTTYLVDDV